MCYWSLVYQNPLLTARGVNEGFSSVTEKMFFKGKKKENEGLRILISLVSHHTKTDLFHFHCSISAFPLTLHHFPSNPYTIKVSFYLTKQNHWKKPYIYGRSKWMNWGIRGSAWVTWEISAIIKQGYIKCQSLLWMKITSN